ncbi:hypothetical protein RUA4292_04468 [Ruegeria atlantica]|uniref:Uncharacterized protein n=2 Tax=Ruegeria atlantica TaxID=81569 RepID=A0A0N7LRA3_9RHOB|nr:hypothetical protein RUA4292_04468 [Ruegeria atlantica]
MKCYIVCHGYGPTYSTVGWMAEKDGPYIHKRNRNWDKWAPMEDLQYQTGGNTWQAAGPLTDETVERLKDFWIGTGSDEPLNDSHVIGAPDTQPWIDTVVDQIFVDAMSAFDDRLFSFVQHEKVWDRGRDCPPWDGAFYIATLLPLRPSFDLQHSDLLPSTDVAERYRGSHSSSGARRAVKLSATLETPIWRDAYTREVMCTEEARAALEVIGIKEWWFMPCDLIEDRH